MRLASSVVYGVGRARSPQIGTSDRAFAPTGPVRPAWRARLMLTTDSSPVAAQLDARAVNVAIAAVAT